jgi:hypothetical protein
MRHFCGPFLMIAMACLAAPAAQALPGGRAWAPAETLNLNGHQNTYPDRFEPLLGGPLRLVGRGSGGPGQFLLGFEWADSAWNVRWVNRHDSGHTFTTLTCAERELVVFRAFGTKREGFVYDSLVVADVSADSLATPDTVTTASDYVVFYSAAASREYEWVAVYDPEYAFTKVVQRRRGQPWHTFFLQAQSGALGVSLAPLSDSTVLLVTGGGRIRRDVITPTGWTEETPDLAESGFAISPLRPDGEGGYWIAWTSGEETAVVTRRLKDGTWTRQDSLTADYLPPSPHQFSNNIAISQDAGPRPAIAWMAYGQSGVEYVYVSWPTDSGWTRGEQLPGSSGGGSQQLTQDENGDIWIGWWKFFEGILWTHSYATATSSAPEISERSGQPLLHWSLSAPAPGTWWAVMCSNGDGAFERVARLKAGPDTVMAWADTSAPAGVSLRYAVRRECRDTRYQWTSAQARWEPRGPSLTIVLRSVNPATNQIELEIVGANQGALDLRLYDLQGREVARHSARAAGAGRDAASLRLDGALRPGLYLLRVRAADGRLSPSAKVAIVR